MTFTIAEKNRWEAVSAATLRWRDDVGEAIAVHVGNGERVAPRAARRQTFGRFFEHDRLPSVRHIQLRKFRLDVAKPLRLCLGVSGDQVSVTCSLGGFFCNRFSVRRRVLHPSPYVLVVDLVDLEDKRRACISAHERRVALIEGGPLLLEPSDMKLFPTAPTRSRRCCGVSTFTYEGGPPSTSSADADGVCGGAAEEGAGCGCCASMIVAAISEAEAATKVEMR